MGEESARITEQHPGKDRGSTETVRPGTRPERPAADTRPAAAGTPAAGTGTRPAAGTRPGTGTETEKEKVSGLAPVTGTPPAPEPPKKKARRKSAPKKKEETTFNADQISALILSTSAIVGSRPGMEVFTLTQTEAQQLATPIANMIEKSEKLSKMSEHADALALVSASLIIFAPRILVYHDQQKQKKIAASGGVKVVHEKRKGEGSARKPDESHAAHGPESNAGVLSSIPVVG